MPCASRSDQEPIKPAASTRLPVAMGAVSQPLPCRLGLLKAVVQIPASRCSTHSNSISSLRQSRCAHCPLNAVTEELQASIVADEQPVPFEEASSASEPDEAQLQHQVAEFGKAVAQGEQDAFLAAQHNLPQQQAEQPRQQATRTEQSQGGAATVTRDGRTTPDTGAATPAANVGAPSDGASLANALDTSAPTASAKRQADSTAAQGATASTGKLDMAAAVREKLTRAAEYRKVAVRWLTCATARMKI
jgi:hypothetical protein